MHKKMEQRGTEDREAVIRRFLESAGLGGAERVKLAGDASFRKYERLTQGEKRYVLMDAPPEKEDVRPFVEVAQRLVAAGLSAPAIIEENVGDGLLLLEDLGDDLYSRVLGSSHGAQEQLLYGHAVDALVHLLREKIHAKVPAYDDALMLREAALFTDWFLPQVYEESDLPALQAEYAEMWRALLPQARNVPETLVLRDYHADNLLWLPERAGVARVGQLDFQDAVIGPCTYDLVSLLEDARRDVAKETVHAMLSRMMDALPEVDEQAFRASYAILGAQRNCKIVGIFVRLAVRDGKFHYLKFLPRVWKHLEHDLQHPLLAELRAWMDKLVPAACRGEIAIHTARKPANG